VLWSCGWGCRSGELSSVGVGAMCSGGFGACRLLQTPSAPRSAAAALQGQLLHVSLDGNFTGILGSQVLKLFSGCFVDISLCATPKLCLNSFLGSQVLLWNIVVRLFLPQFP